MEYLASLYRVNMKQCVLVKVNKHTVESRLSSHVGTNKSGWISEVAGFQGMFNVEDESNNQCVPD